MQIDQRSTAITENGALSAVLQVRLCENDDPSTFGNETNSLRWSCMEDRVRKVAEFVTSVDSPQ